MNKSLFNDVAKAINKTLGRNAVTTQQIQSVIAEAKNVRQTKGLLGLVNYGNKIPNRFFSDREINKLKQSPYWKEFSFRMIDCMVQEGIISRIEAAMLKKYV